MRLDKRLSISIGISIAIHLIFFAVTTEVKLEGVEEQLTKRKVFQVKNIRSQALARRKKNQSQSESSKVLKFENPQYQQLINNYIKDEAIKKSNDIPVDQDLVEPIDLNKQDLLAKNIDDAQILKPRFKRDTRKEMVTVANPETAKEIANLDDLLDQSKLPEEFVEKMPGFTPKHTEDVFDMYEDGGDFDYSDYLPVLQRKTSLVDLKEYLVTNISTYEDKEDKQKYFKISIRVGRDVEELEAFKKELIFLVDCSLSIKDERLEQFKEGMEYSLKNLNEGDYFNILAFKEKTLKFRKVSVKPTQKNIEEALRFIDNLTAGNKTDTYTALYDSIKEKNLISPAYIILFSDGRATQGVTDSRKIINEISRMNNGRASIFAFSGGLKVNRYLLDFITYKNRGWTEYSYRSHLIGKHIANMYEKIKNPFITNLNYRMSGLNPEDIFPKTLPDFFRNAEFTIYGKYDQENQFVLQLLGDLTTEKSEFIIEGALQKARTGDEHIAKNWAFNKIYYLIGQIADNQDNTAIIEEIKRLSQKFDIYTPYLKVIQ
ncbi:MAG: VWA domain-containing protein [Candidatus Omnitrophica bacterium]|nr:VWA domain-containing protein [Candidatus Omnitrophota bacterium]MCB9747480.1 VWA domain-containing protein [Candidatus Omnitrophota bacterium]